MSVNALLIRWKHGYTSVGASTPPIQWGYLTLGSIETATEAERIGTVELARMGGVRDQISLGADPDPADPADAYGTGWDVGDYVLAPDRSGVNAAARVLQVSLSEDDNAALTIMPDLSSLLEQRAVRTQRWLSRMADGTMNGTSAVASPIVTPEFVPGRRPGSTTQTMSWNPASTERTSPWTPEVAGRLAQMHLRRTGDLIGDTVVAFIVNGVTLDEGTIYDGDEEGIFGGSGVDFRPGDKLELEPTDISGADNLTARVVQTHYH